MDKRIDKFRKMLALRRTECVCVTGWVPFKNTLADFKIWFGRHKEPRQLIYAPEHGYGMDDPTRTLDVKDIQDCSNAIIVTHDRFIISNFRRKNVILFTKDGDVQEPEFETFGASVNKIMMCLFGKAATIGSRAEEEMKQAVTLCEEGSNDTAYSIEYISKNFGESVEKTLSIHTLMNMEDKEKEKKHANSTKH